MKVRRYMGGSEAARMLGVSEQTIRNWLLAGKLLGKFHSGQWRILRAHVEALVAGKVLMDRWP